MISEVINKLLETKKSPKLEGFILDKGVDIETNLGIAIKDSELIVLAIPTAFITDVCKELKKYVTIKIIELGWSQDTYPLAARDYSPFFIFQ